MPAPWPLAARLRPVCLSFAALLKRGVSPFLQESSMISRYARPEIASIWEAQTRLKIWFEIEAHEADALAELGVIPNQAGRAIWAKARDVPFDVARTD